MCGDLHMVGRQVDAGHGVPMLINSIAPVSPTVAGNRSGGPDSAMPMFILETSGFSGFLFEDNDVVAEGVTIVGAYAYMVVHDS